MSGYKRDDKTFKSKLATRADELKPFRKTPTKVLTVTIDEAGDLTYLKSDSADVLLELGEVIQRRASHVEPGTRAERILFHILRFVFGDKGRVAEWTRHWFTLWRVNTKPVGGPILRVKHVKAVCVSTYPEYGEQIAYFIDRQEAIDAEIKFLNDFFLERGIQ